MTSISPLTHTPALLKPFLCISDRCREWLRVLSSLYLNAATEPSVWFYMLLYQQIDTSVTCVSSFRNNSTLLHCNSTKRILCEFEMGYVLLFEFLFHVVVKALWSAGNWSSTELLSPIQVHEAAMKCWLKIASKGLLHTYCVTDFEISAE